MENNKLTKICIANATGPTNFGDQVILEGTLMLLNKKYNNLEITLHSSEPLLYKDINVKKIDHTLYSWTAFENKNAIVRLSRIIQLFLLYTFKNIIFNISFFSHNKIISLLNDYKNADRVIFVGGGYLRSQKGITQSLNLIMILFMFKFANFLNKEVTILPMSFGPFAHKWQEKYSAIILKKFGNITVREDFSYNALKIYNIKNITLSSDTAFLIPKNKKPVNDKFILGFTIRNWMDKESQDKFENYFFNTLVKFAEEKNAKIQPIVQVSGIEYGDNDTYITKGFYDKLKSLNIDVMDIQIVNNLEQAKNIYSSIDLLLGMRMHSNIIAATQGTPFVAISYEYKTIGIANELGFQNYVIDCTNVDQENLYLLLNKSYKDIEILKTIIMNNVENIQNQIYKKLLPLL